MLSTYLSTVFFHQDSLCNNAPTSFSFSSSGCKQGTWKPKWCRLQLRQELLRDGIRPKKLDSKINQEALRLGGFGTATKTTNTARTCCPSAFCAHEMPLLKDAVCNIHWSCTTALCAMWWLDMQVPSDSGQVPTASPKCSHRPPWHSALRLPARAASTWNHSQKSSTEVSLADSKAETSTLLVNHTKKPCAWVCTSGTRSTFPLPAPVSWNQTHAAQRSKGRGWSQDGKAQKPPPHCPRNFPWLTCAPLLCDSIFLPLLAVRTTVIPDGICSHVSPTQCACTRVLTCFV